MLRRSQSNRAHEGLAHLNSVGLFLLTACGCLCVTAASAAVNVSPLGMKSHYPDAVARGAFSLACAGTGAELNTFFRAKGLPFDTRIVRRRKDDQCHLFYEPTVRGFRARPRSAETGTCARIP
jgi:hypothetical protein